MLSSLTSRVTIVTQSPHDIEALLRESLTVDVFANIKPPEPFAPNPELSEKTSDSQASDDIELQVTDLTGKTNKQYILPRLPGRSWGVSIDITL
jgi:hypothetical protein